MLSYANTLTPKLRSIDAQPFAQNGEPALLLRDPLQLSGNYLVLPRDLGPVLGLFDGRRDLGGIRSTFAMRYGEAIPSDLLQQLIGVLDENYMLDNDRSAEAHQRSLQAYRQAAYRPPMLAGQSYPADPSALRQMFDSYLDRVNGIGYGPAHGSGVISPHIDYPRGGMVYAAVWKRAAEMARAADLVVLLGTDHYSMGDRLTLTRQSYATPYGVLPTDTDIVDALVEVIGEEAAFAGELRNRGEHSLELVATWLHHMRHGEPVALVPILTGSFADFVLGQGDPAGDAELAALINTLSRASQGRNVLVVASGDLSHVGPAFGGPKMDANGRARIKAADDELMQLMAGGSAEGFFAAIRRDRDRNNVCGVSPFYLMLRLLGNVEGQILAYDQCPADQANASLVSVCGMVFNE